MASTVEGLAARIPFIMTRRLSHNSSRRTVEVHVDDDEVTFQLYDDLMPPMQSREALSRSNKSLMLIPPEELEERSLLKTAR